MLPHHTKKSSSKGEILKEILLAARRFYCRITQPAQALPPGAELLCPGIAGGIIHADEATAGFFRIIPAARLPGFDDAP
jgi:hypothetical protein